MENPKRLARNAFVFLAGFSMGIVTFILLESQEPEPVGYKRPKLRSPPDLKLVKGG